MPPFDCEENKEKQLKEQIKQLKEKNKKLQERCDELNSLYDNECDRRYKYQDELSKSQEERLKLANELKQITQERHSFTFDMLGVVQDICIGLITKQDPRIERRKIDLKNNNGMGIRRPY